MLCAPRSGAGTRSGAGARSCAVLLPCVAATMPSQAMTATGSARLRTARGRAVRNLITYIGYSRPKASNTLPGLPPNAPYPEPTTSIPPAIAGPGPIIDAPRAGTPLTAVNSRLVSNCHTIAPSDVEYARSIPSFDPEKATPGMAVTAADCAALQPRPLPHAGGGAGVCH